MKRHAYLAVAVAMALCVMVPRLHAQQGEIIEGTVVNAETGEPLAGAQLQVVGTQRGNISGSDGTFRITNVPAGTRELRAQFVGFGTQTLSVQVESATTAAVEIELQRAVIDMQEIVVTGVAGETARGKLSFTVDRISQADLPVALAGNPAAMLTGKVSGANIVSSSGRPGAEPSVMLRGPTSISSDGRNQDPLYIVDGVILSESIVDIGAMDIESIEVVKGAAAASLYGARAANGVIQITTQRGRDVADNSVRYTVRSEFGKSDLPGRFNLTQRHHFALSEDGGQFLEQSGEGCDWLNCENVALAGQRSLGESANLWNTIQREAWPGQTYDHVDRFFDPGTHMTNAISVAGRSGATNYHLSFNRVQEDGVMDSHGGLTRNTFRINLDQSVREDFMVSAMAAYTVSKEDPRDGSLFQLTRMPAGIDIAAPDPTYPDFFVLKPDPNNDNANPLNSMRAESIVRDRNRFLANVTATWSPLSWVDLEGQVALDRLDRNDSDHTPRGARDLNGAEDIGDIFRGHRRIQGLNTAFTARLQRRFGDLNVTSSVRYLYEREDERRVEAESEEFVADGVYTIDNTPDDRQEGSSLFEPERRDGFFVSTLLDFRDRYVLDALVRQDGNSRFGPESRRAWYYRVGGTYRIAEEPWFSVPGVDDFGIRYSIGSAGNAPNFSGQFETFDVEGGVITMGALGNRDLKPEVVTEQEMGFDVLFGRVSADFTYARSKTEDALLQVPLLAYRGFETQWQNAASMKSNTIEASLQAQVVRTPTFSWTTRVLFDRTRQQVTSMTVPPFQQGIDQQG